MTAPFSERDLVDRVVSGDPGAAQEFVDRYWGFVRAVALRTLGRYDTGFDEVPQNVFVRLWEDDHRRLRRWRGEGDFVNYLGPIVRHLTQDYLRERARRPAQPPGHPGGEPDTSMVWDPPGEDAGGEYEALVTERRAAVRASLERMAPRDRELLERRFLREEGPAAIAAALGMTTNHVYVALHRAQKRLGELLRSAHPELVRGVGRDRGVRKRPRPPSREQER